MPYSLPIGIMNLRTLRQFLLTCSDHWFREDGWSLSIADRTRPERALGKQRQSIMKCRPSKLKGNFVKQGLRSSAGRIASLRMIPIGNEYWLITPRQQ